MNSATHAWTAGKVGFPAAKGKDQKREEFERVAIPQLSNLYTSALYLTKDKAEAEDLVQETYLRGFRFFDRFEAGTNMRAWLLSILRNLFINRYRQIKREPATLDWEKIDEVYESIVEKDMTLGSGSPEQQLVSQMLDEEIEAALNELPEDFRTAIVLVDIDELTYEETAKVMGCPIGTVRSRVSRGRRILQVALRDYARRTGIAGGARNLA